MRREVEEHRVSRLDDDDEMIMATVRRHELPQGEPGRGRLQTRGVRMGGRQAC
jgi:hypothetical protein